MGKDEKIEYEVSSGNIFEDFNYPNPEEAQAKSDIAFLIRGFIKKNGLTQEEAAIMMGVDQPKVSKITRGILNEFTLEWMMNCLLRLGFDVEIKAKLSKHITPSIHFSPALAFA
jgi:predicted XRE-type DNA-binding protein